MSKPHNQNSQRQQQDRRLFRIFNYYRVLLSLTLLFTYSNEVGKVFIGLEYPLLFIATTLVYTAINIALALVLLSDQPLQPQQIALNILIDILALSLLAAYLCVVAMPCYLLLFQVLPCWLWKATALAQMP